MYNIYPNFFYFKAVSHVSQFRIVDFYQALLCTLEEINITFFPFFFKIFVLLSQPPVTVQLLAEWIPLWCKKEQSFKKKQSLLFSIKYYICCLSPWHLKVYGPGALQELTLVTQLHIFCYIQNMLEIHWGKLIYRRRDKGMLWLMNKEPDMSSREVPFIIRPQKMTLTWTVWCLFLSSCRCRNLFWSRELISCYPKLLKTPMGNKQIIS